MNPLLDPDGRRPDDQRHYRNHRGRALRDLAARQFGMISAPQLATLGYDRDEILRLSRRGLLTPQHRGCYAFGPPQDTFLSRCWGASLAVGPAAILSHQTSAAIWSMIERPPPVIDITIIGTRRRSRPGMRVHHATHRWGLVRTLHWGLRVADPGWTLVDITATAGPSVLRQAARTALVVHGTDLAAVRRLLARRRPTKARALLDALDAVDDPAMLRTTSELERRFLTFVIEQGLPIPNVNVPLLRFEVDFLWEAQRIVVETDGSLGHAGADRRRRDARRDAALAAAGYTVLRVNWAHLHDTPNALLARLETALGINGTQPRPARHA